MKHTRIEQHIDDKISTKLNSGDLTLSEINDHLIESSEKFSTRSDFMDVSKFDLLSNWKNVHIKKRYTTFYVIHSRKRNKDIEWLMQNKDRFPNLSDGILFKLIKFKEKIK